ncbi:MAG: peptidoglycan-binding domain-containing protein, partial [Patescibacteria group bacterium]
MLKARIATIGLSLALGLSMVAPASAVTVAELQAQINALMAQLSALQGGTTSVGTTFTADLTVGSTGAQVSALQQVLVSNGYLVMPSGVAMGYFGSLTKSAVMKWQAAVGLPSTGFFGPMSRAKLNGSTGATGTVPGTTIGGVTSGTISTPGVEGTITVSLNPTPASAKLYEGDSKRDVLGIKLEAKTSDIKIERLKLKLDEASDSTTNDTDF